MSFLAAFKFLTILPISRRREIDPKVLGRSVTFFPIVGLVIGLALAGIYWVLSLILPVEVVAGLIIVCGVVLSGGLHLDGFVDTFDGIGGQKPAEERWRAMEDSRAGAFGIISVVCLILVKFVLLRSMPADHALFSLILMGVASRWAMVFAIFTYRYAKPLGLGTAFKTECTWLRYAIATIITLAVAIPLFSLAGIAVLVGVCAGAAIFAVYLKHKFKGMTGDTYGAINEVAEMLVLLLVLVIAYNGWLGLVS